MYTIYITVYNGWQKRLLNQCDHSGSPESSRGQRPQCHIYGLVTLAMVPALQPPPALPRPWRDSEAPHNLPIELWIPAEASDASLTVLPFFWWKTGSTIKVHSGDSEGFWNIRGMLCIGVVVLCQRAMSTTMCSHCLGTLSKRVLENWKF